MVEEQEISEERPISEGRYEIFMRDDGLLQVNIFKDTKVEVADAKEMVRQEGELSGGVKLPTLHIMGKYVVIGEGVREYSAKSGTKFTSAEAYVLTSLAHRILGNFYLKVNKPAVPTRLFNNEGSAVQWLNKFR